MDRIGEAIGLLHSEHLRESSERSFSTGVVSTKLGCAGTCMLVSSDCTSCCLSSCTKESSCCCGVFTMGGCVQHWLDKLNASDKILDHHVEYCH